MLMVNFNRCFFLDDKLSTVSESFPNARGATEVWYGILEFNVPLDTV